MNDFAKPDGFLGKIAVQYMTVEYHAVNMWAVHILDVQPTDKILEVGFGPGVAIQEIAKRVPTGYIVGIDYSELMLAQAKERNLQAIQERRVDLRHANVSDLPAIGIIFDKIIAINNIMYWPNRIDALQGLRKTLKPGGLILVILQGDYEQVQKGKYYKEINRYARHLEESGFMEIKVCIQPVTRKPNGTYGLAGICIRGFNPALCHRAK
ncbi:MAG: class I SAM-dependent methyltransferase [Cyanobacteria bacterium]|nr:class I SAM-dependent methyltransferase [Cyanobacteriota bacterium]